MAKKLVIVESPTKARIIGKFLGKEYEVLASRGHIRDLPEHSLGVDLEHGFQPEYEVSKDKASVIAALKKAAKECEEIYLAPDPDREGEAIAWHLREALQGAARKKPFFRVQYNEITPRAVSDAFAHPGEIDMQRVNAQQARRVLDRIVGYKVSPLLWRRLHKGLSAGRVQSVALRLVAERERKIQSFQPVEYWVMGAKVLSPKSPKDPFLVRLSKIDGKSPVVPREGETQPPTLSGKGIVDEIRRDLEGSRLKVDEIKQRETSRHALPPFITSTMQQAASSVLGYEPKRTMKLAQSLFEGGKGGVGLITYMRTDSVNISKEARAAAEAYITQNYGSGYFSQNYYKSRSGAQEAHEAIRPTDVTRTPESLVGQLDAAELKLYELIWKRFVASLMSSAKVAQKTVCLKPERAGGAPYNHDYTFTVSSSELLYDGFLKVMALDFRKKKEEDEAEDEDDEVDRLPQLAPGDLVDVLEWLAEQKQNKPPARFSEASLIKALEANGVGRPSTYATIIDTLNSRKYTKHEKRQLIPTELGLSVNDLLVSKMPRLFDVGFTASMESELDEVESGKVEWQAMMGNFYGFFTQWLAQSKEPPADTQRVNEVLSLLSQVKQWAEPMSHGKRPFSEEKFVASIREQLEKGEKPISEKQLAALAHIAVRYRGQIPDGEQRLCAMGYSDEVKKDAAAPDQESVSKRLALLATLEMGDRQKKFTDSLRRQVERGRKLSERQLSAVNSIILENRHAIADFEAVCEELGLPKAEAGAAAPADNESPILLKLLAEVKEWAAPVTHGKRTFSDQEFVASVTRQFGVKHALSPKQRFAMKRLCGKYKAQIADFDQYAEQLGMTRKPKEAIERRRPHSEPSVSADGTGVPPPEDKLV
ncbi:MAG: type I DNA topoisomerase [Kiritimatiellae bacterium]|nr:type I DNA topoisomerase [Kiritimatiellia bacterium]